MISIPFESFLLTKGILYSGFEAEGFAATTPVRDADWPNVMFVMSSNKTKEPDKNFFT